MNQHTYTEDFYVRTGQVSVIGCRYCPWASGVDTSDAQGWPWILYQSADDHKNCLNNNDIGLLVGKCKCEGWRQGHWNTCQQDLTLQVYALSAGSSTSQKKLRTGLCGISAVDAGNLKKHAETYQGSSKNIGRMSQRKARPAK